MYNAVSVVDQSGIAREAVRLMMQLDACKGHFEVAHIVVDILTVAHVSLMVIGSLSFFLVVVWQHHRVRPCHL